MKRPLASWICLGAHFERPGVLLGRPGRGPGEVQRGAGEALEASWWSVGALETSRGLWGAIGGLLGRSWRRLGALLDPFRGLLGAKVLPTRGPRGSQIESKR